MTRKNGDAEGVSKPAVLEVKVTFDPDTQRVHAEAGDGWKNLSFIQHVLEQAAEAFEFQAKVSMAQQQQQAQMEQAMKAQIAAQQQQALQRRIIEGK